VEGVDSATSNAVELHRSSGNLRETLWENPPKLLRLSSTFCYFTKKASISHQGSPAANQKTPFVWMFASLVGAAQSGQIINRIVVFFLSFLVAAEADLLARESILKEKCYERRAMMAVR
jgi:hypothetical protein